ncbi:MAG: cupin domain-containing protein [Granulosicoccus sp.]
MNTTLNMTPKDIIETLELKPHPEGGWYRQTWCGEEQPRASGTSIYFLLEAFQHSRWHRVDAVEIWHWYAGSPMELHIHEDGRTQVKVLGPDISSDHRPQLIVPAHAWQQSIPMLGWVLVGCTVSPGFQFSGFELADESWSPDTAKN